MWGQDGIQPMTCCALYLNTRRHINGIQQTKVMTYELMNWKRMSGKSWNSCATFWRWEFHGCWCNIQCWHPIMILLDTQECHTFLFTIDAQPCQCHSNHGCYQRPSNNDRQWSNYLPRHSHGHWTRKKDIEPILFTDRWVGNVPYRDEYVFFLITHSLAHILPKSFIPSTSCNTLRQQNGRTNGFPLRKHFFGHSMSLNTAKTEMRTKSGQPMSQTHRYSIYFLWNITLVLTVNRRHPLKGNQPRKQICSTPFSSQQSHPVTFAMKLTGTFPLILRLWTTSFCGGGSAVQCTLVFHEWHWIIWAFLVCLSLASVQLPV